MCQIGECKKTLSGGLIIWRNLKMTTYKPYSPEWHRKRNLKEALDRYIDEYIDNDTILDDICSILNERSERAYQEFAKVNDLEDRLR